MNDHLATHRREREALLAAIVQTLAADERVVAAWLTGSYARGAADALSDIDLTVVIEDDPAEELCRRAEMVTAWPPAERLALFSQFGRPLDVYENHFNAPPGGTSTSVLYQPAALAHLADAMEALTAEAGRRGLVLRPAPREAIDGLLRLRFSSSSII